MHKRTSVFSNPITERRFLQHLKEKQDRQSEHFNNKEKRIYGDNSSEQIINAISENYDNKKQAKRQYTHNHL